MKDPRLYIRLLKYLKERVIIRQDVVYLIYEEFMNLSKDNSYPLYGYKNFSLGITKYLVKNEMKKLEYNFLEKDNLFQEIHPVKADSRIARNDQIRFTRIEFLNAIEEAYEQGLLNDQDYAKTHNLRKNCSYEAFQEKTKDAVFLYTNNIKESFPVPVSVMTELLNLPTEELESILDTNPYGLTKTEFVHCVTSYFINQGIHQKYFLPKQLIENIEALKQKVDTTAVEYNIYSSPNYVDEIEVNDELWNAIINKIPEDFDTLEKAYYIYYQLCKTFTYSDAFFAQGESQKNSSSRIVRKISDLPNLNKDDNNVVCYEIMGIYQKFLKHLGLKYDVNTWEGKGPHVSYDLHPSLTIIIDDYVVEADATRGVISGDMPLAKENRPLKGFCCFNEHPVTKAKFNASLDKVNRYIADTEKQETSFFDVLNAYEEVSEQANEPFILTDSEKLSILMNSLAQTDLSETDRLVYTVELTRSLFPKRNCKNYFVLQHQPDKVLPTIATIFTYYDENDKESLRYFSYSTASGLQEKTLEELQKDFDQDRYEYMIRYKHEIPDVKGSKGGDKFAI